MKKILFILMLIPGIGLSQSIGLKAGSIYSNGGNKGYWTGVAGVTFNVNLAKKFQLGIEPSYAKYKIDVAYTVNGKVAGHRKYSHSYFELPITLGFVTGEKVIGGFYGGAVPKVLLKAELEGQDLVANNGVYLDVIGGGLIGYKFSEKFAGIINARYGQVITNATFNNYVSIFLNIQYKL